MSVAVENNSWDYVQRLIEKEINSAFKLRMKENEIKNDNNMEVIAKIPEQPVGWLETKLPTFVMERLQSYIDKSRTRENIKRTIEDKDDWFFETILVPLIINFTKNFPSYTKQINLLTENAAFSLERFWVNYQKQHEFNPPHFHEGIWSFVIWMNIPTDWKEQHAFSISIGSNNPRESNFEFQYTTMLGEIGYHPYFLNKESEGTMLFFPAKLLHVVFPFYNCDEERISLSGNINFDISENSMRQLRSQ